jgi:hypothetical protein
LKIVKPLTVLTKNKFKEKKFKTLDATKYVFKTLKAVFIFARILRYFDHRLPMAIDLDTSNFVIRAILLKLENGNLKPMAFHSRKMYKAKINYTIYDKEMLAIISTFKQEYQYLKGTFFIITVFSTYKNLEYFATFKVLNSH